jgi:hypothetical protein
MQGSLLLSQSGGCFSGGSRRNAKSWGAPDALKIIFQGKNFIEFSFFLSTTKYIT